MEILLYLIIAILMFQIFIITLLNYKPRESCCGGNACCKEKVDGLSNPIPTQEFCCKDDMSDCSCDEPFIIEGINDFERKTEITGMGGRGGPVDSVRSRHNDIEKQNEAYNKMIRESEDVIDNIDTIPTNEPLEENDPNIHKK